MDLQKFEAHANDIWSEFLGVTKFVFWQIPSLIGVIILQLLGVFLILGLILGAIAFVISIIFQ
ncbi:MAG: hypothetical protein K5860_02410 [Bacteroidales bacterium]|nr:hypothetical protein [Bacteroidales bacterium]